MKRIIIHWTGGAYFPCNKDIESYHFLIDKNGKIYKGKYRPEDNENCNDGIYAKHCGGGNTGAIGVALCAMAGFDLKNKKTDFPITKIQCYTLFKLLADLSAKYNIPISPKTVLTHYEFAKTHINTSSFGKIDIVFLPCFPNIQQDKIGDFIRENIFSQKIY